MYDHVYIHDCTFEYNVGIETGIISAVYKKELQNIHISESPIKNNVVT